jgi:hypothetical protein
MVIAQNLSCAPQKDMDSFAATGFVTPDKEDFSWDS